MKDNGIIGIYADSAEGLIEDLNSALKSLQEDEEEGLSTLVFCQYSPFTIRSECVYVLNQRGHLIFLESPKSMTLFLDPQLKPLRLEFEPEAKVFLTLMAENDAIQFLGTHCDEAGNLLNAFCFSEEKDIQFGVYWLKNLMDSQIEGVVLDEEEIAQIAADYLEIRREKFLGEVEVALKTGEFSESLSDNPYSDLYFNNA